LWKELIGHSVLINGAKKPTNYCIEEKKLKIPVWHSVYDPIAVF